MNGGVGGVVGVGGGDRKGWTGQNGGDVTFHGLFVEAIEAQAGGGWRTGGARSRKAAHGGESVHEDAVYGVRHGAPLLPRGVRRPS